MGGYLLLVLEGGPGAGLVDLGHSAQSFLMIFQLLSERLCQRFVGDVYRWRCHRRVIIILNLQRRTVVGGPNTARGDHEVVLLDHTAGRLGAVLIRRGSQPWMSMSGKMMLFMRPYISASSSGMTSTRFLNHIINPCCP